MARSTRKEKSPFYNARKSHVELCAVRMRNPIPGNDLKRAAEHILLRNMSIRNGFFLHRNTI